MEIISAYRLQLAKESPHGRQVPSRGRWSADFVTWLHSLVEQEPQEVLGAVLLDARARVIGYTIAYRGTLNRVAVEPRGVLAPAMLANAAAVILFHNHPSGDPTPSAADLSLTRRLSEAGEILGIPVLDHLIFGESPRYRSALAWGRPYALPVRSARTAKPKYRHPETGETWAGRGSMANWLKRELAAGATLADFALER